VGVGGWVDVGGWVGVGVGPLVVVVSDCVGCCASCVGHIVVSVHSGSYVVEPHHHHHLFILAGTSFKTRERRFSASRSEFTTAKVAPSSWQLRRASAQVTGFW
jgi:hypothetical protein